MKKIILAVIIIIMAITAVGCGSTGGEAENINTAAIEEAVKNALNEQKYASTGSETENVNTAAIKEAVKDALDEQEREKKGKGFRFFSCSSNCLVGLHCRSARWACNYNYVWLTKTEPVPVLI